jgi:hypothetical protein
MQRPKGMYILTECSKVEVLVSGHPSDPSLPPPMLVMSDDCMDKETFRQNVEGQTEAWLQLKDESKQGFSPGYTSVNRSTPRESTALSAPQNNVCSFVKKDTWLIKALNLEHAYDACDQSNAYIELSENEICKEYCYRIRE